MTFRVIVTDPAFADIEEAADYIWTESPGNARRWLSDCWRAIDTLKEMPHRNAVIPEADLLGLPYRSLPLHAHRLIYRIDEERSVVYIVRLYHGARRPLTIEDV
jgi:plasmid stabilization system protein ParE